MSHEPSIRDCIKIVESYNHAVEEGLGTPRTKLVFKNPVAGTAVNMINSKMKAHLQPNRAFFVDDNTIEMDVPAGIEVDITDSVIDELGGMYESIEEDDKPYATMKDGPDKYLFRKDGKQKLVGSADNEPENGEEELEETDMDKFIREMQIAAGIKLNEETGGPFDSKKDAQSNAKSEIGGGEEGTNFKTHKKDDGWYWTEKVDEGKLPDALKKHQFGKKDDDKADDKEEVDEDVINWMKRFDRLSTPVTEEVDEEVIEEDCPTDPEKNADGDCSPFTHADDNVDMVRETPYEDEGWQGKIIKITSGEYAGQTGKVQDVNIYHSDEGVKKAEFTINLQGGETVTIYPSEFSPDQLEVEEDLLLAPPGDVGPSVDEDDMVYGREGRGKSYGSKDFDKFEEDCPTCGGMSKPEGLDAHYDEHPFADEGDYVTSNVKPWQEDCPDCNIKEAGPGEFDYDPDAMIDVGDNEDYEDYSNFDDEFEAMLGGSSDMPEAKLVGMYEMNRLRELAGLEQIMEEKRPYICVHAKKGKHECHADSSYGAAKKAAEHWGLKSTAGIDAHLATESIEEDDIKIKGVNDKYDDDTLNCKHCGDYFCTSKFGGECPEIQGDLFDEDHAGTSITGDVIAYEIDDERAYYLMQDILGAKLDFGPEDEILVPLELNDLIVSELEKQGFEKGEAFWEVGKQYEADLQNGYNDRKFSDGQDYFPKGATNQPATDLGPTASAQTDNPMSNKMRSIEKDDVYETMKLAYRRHRKS